MSTGRNTGAFAMQGVVVMKIGSIVRINDSNEWNGLYGVVKYLKNNIAYIFCVQNPCYLYVIDENSNVCIIEE